MDTSKAVDKEAPLPPEAANIPENSVAPVRALLRGLDALSALNELNGATITEVARRTGQPRSTAYRTLRTLCYAGYAVRDPTDERYRPTIKVRSLAEGFQDEPWIRNIARPQMAALGTEVVWPVTFATVYGHHMLMRDTTDRDSPLALNRYAPGLRVPMLVSAAGRVHLAFCPPGQRQALIDVLAASDDPADRLARDTSKIEAVINEVQRNGYAYMVRRKLKESTVAVPVLAAGDKLLGALGIRYITTAMTPEQAIERYVPPLNRTAKEIARLYDQG